ncbi:MAG: helix-turn-helix domain-containing protein [Chloroflexi bacterium]|nr:helix-turn-helix domain-containing protein [Chloroflexota bacterium]
MNGSFGTWLKQRRNVLDLTQKEVAQQVGCSMILLRKVEANERRPSKQIAERLADVLDVAPYERAAFITAARRVPTHESPRHLPRPTSPFIGRTDELAHLGTYLADSSCRLLTLVGAGGIGKTRLAVQAATIYGNPYMDGVFFVPLDGLSAPEYIVPTVAQYLQFNFMGSESPENQLMSFLHDKALLLVLDNFEHLIDARELLLTMLDNTVHLKLLVTSRERLNVQQEWTLEIEGLHFEEQSDDAVQLFIQRATQLNHHIEASDMPYVLDICRLLDGKPLGIELAASWLYLLTCKEIAEQMRTSLDFLTSDAPDIDVRHRSLRKVFDHSWALLSPVAQSVLRKLSVFRGGFRQEAAEVVAGATLATLAELRNKSLLRRDEQGRFHLHEMLRQYAAHQLDAEESFETHFAHAHYYAEFTQQSFNPIDTSLEEFFEVVRHEIENVRAAWYWAIDNHHLPFLRLM